MIEFFFSPKKRTEEQFHKESLQLTRTNIPSKHNSNPPQISFPDNFYSGMEQNKISIEIQPNSESNTQSRFVTNPSQPIPNDFFPSLPEKKVDISTKQELLVKDELSIQSKFNSNSLQTQPNKSLSSPIEKREKNPLQKESQINSQPKLIIKSSSLPRNESEHLLRERKVDFLLWQLLKIYLKF
jgi:hypothetical protein